MSRRRGMSARSPGIMGVVASLGLAAAALGGPAAADEVTDQRLLNAGQEHDNWIHHHHD